MNQLHILVAMDRFLRRVEVEDQLLRRKIEGTDDVVEKNLVHLTAPFPAGTILQVAVGLRIAEFGAFANGRLLSEIAAKLVGAVQILVATDYGIDS